MMDSNNRCPECKGLKLSLEDIEKFVSEIDSDIPPHLERIVRLAALDVASDKAINDGDSLGNTVRLASQHLKAIKALTPADLAILEQFKDI